MAPRTGRFKIAAAALGAVAAAAVLAFLAAIASAGSPPRAALRPSPVRVGEALWTWQRPLP